MSRPWMPLYVADYLADTGHLRAAESGAYLHLIMHYWQKGGLPDDDRQLATIAKMTDDEWSTSKSVLVCLFQDGWRHKRIEAELARAEEKYVRRAAAGRKGGEAKAKSGHCSSNATAGPDHKSVVVAKATTSPHTTPLAPSSEDLLEARDSEVPRARSSNRASRLPDNWVPSDRGLDFADEQGLRGRDLTNEIEKFRNHWHAKPGKAALKLDWSATWRNWVLNAGNFSGRGPPQRKRGFLDIHLDLTREIHERDRQDLDELPLAGANR